MKKKIVAAVSIALLVCLTLVMSGCEDLFGSHKRRNGGGGGDNTTVPNPPASVSATAVSTTSISVTWSSVSGATSYTVWRNSTAGGTFSKVGTVNSTSFTDSGLSPNTTYYYRVCSVNSKGESDLSDYSSATTQSAVVPGSSSSNAITIPVGGDGINGSFPAGLDAVWYKITYSGIGGLVGYDKDYNSFYTGDIVIDVFNSSLTQMQGPIYVGNEFLKNDTWYGIDIGAGATTGTWIYANNWSGTCYVKVRPYNNSNSNKGTFCLYFVN